MSNRSKKAQAKVIDEKLEELIVNWYAPASGGKFPDHVAEDRKSYRGKILRWLEPTLPGITNPVLIEETLGDRWTLRLEPMRQEIKIFT